MFSVGSITFCGSLCRNGFEGPVSRILEDVVRRFSAPPQLICEAAISPATGLKNINDA